MTQRSLARRAPLALLCALVLGAATPVQGSPDGLLADYRKAGAGPFDAQAGARAWAQDHRPQGATEPRSCASCHGTDLTGPGRHLETGKVIEPMALSANPKRLADPAKAEKWLGRNCRWTLGRECSPQEKGDFLTLMKAR